MEQSKFRPNVPEEIRQEQLAVLERAQKRIESGEVSGEIGHDMEYFLVSSELKTGEKITEHIPKNSGPITLDKEGKESVSVAEAVEAIQRFYPEMEKPSLREAVRRLKEYRR
ncbi:MAG: hypothetical protein WAP51_04720 [Candidatus Sungiibacteriota bacterium]